MGEKRLISLNWIVGYLAMWAVRACPEGWPYRLRELVEIFNEEWDRTESVWMTRPELERHVAPVGQHKIVEDWAHPANQEAGDVGFDGAMLVRLIVESTWANGATEEGTLRGLTLPASVPPIEHGVPLSAIPDDETGPTLDGITLSREVDGRWIAAKEDRPGVQAYGATRVAAIEACRALIAREREESDRAARQAEKRKKAIHEAVWFGVFTASLHGCASVAPVDEAAAKRHGPEAQLTRAHILADAAAKLVIERGIVPPVAAYDFEEIGAVLHESEPAVPIVFNMTNSFGGGESYEAIAGRIMSDIAKAFSRYVVPTKATDVFNPNTGTFETKGNTGAADLADRKRRVAGFEACVGCSGSLGITTAEYEEAALVKCPCCKLVVKDRDGKSRMSATPDRSHDESAPFVPDARG